MWIIDLIPTWIPYAGLFLGALTILITPILANALPAAYSILIRLVAQLLCVFGVWYHGYSITQEAWEDRVDQVQLELGKLRAESQTENIKLVEKVVIKTKIVRERGDDIVKYVDREVVKYDVKFAPGGECEIPKEFIKAHNDAVGAVK
jgi:hypothetical protein